eukprot:1118325-Rhodomonas_salina.1
MTSQDVGGSRESECRVRNTGCYCRLNEIPKSALGQRARFLPRRHETVLSEACRVGCLSSGSQGAERVAER